MRSTLPVVFSLLLLITAMLPVHLHARGFRVIVGSFENPDNAREWQDILYEYGVDTKLEHVRVDGDLFVRVALFDSFDDRGEAVSALNEMRALFRRIGYPAGDLWISPPRISDAGIRRDTIKDNIIEGRVVDALTGKPLRDAKIRIIASPARGTAARSSAGETTSDAQGHYSLKSPEGDVSLEIQSPGYGTTRLNDLQVMPRTRNFAPTIQQVDTGHMGPGSIIGTVRDSATNEALPGVTLKLREGLNTRQGPVIARTITDAEGNYTFTGIKAGNYTAEMSLEKYITGYMELLVLQGQQRVAEETISASLRRGQMRIVLSWGEEPLDLDSHLVGPRESSYGMFHVFFNDRVAELADLDVDDTSSYGPETVTINKLISGNYIYFVHDYSNRFNEYSEALAASGARIKVYNDAGLMRTFYVPPYKAGTIWVVFMIDGRTGQLIPVNRFSNEFDPFNP
ncbi:MAG TPA: carboxypeptidase regulatory-like domain-containing protein [Spirochaetota bacterium]|nr:carboxypeptidase regulatory-like domain-containing protein [Spirochaetota bacterium]HPC40908.1 carboxypeptidase regulatory-like domain-containing protein [Spirochaetota bacterium]HQF08662.1 carboxypeptidase regulatory-like domain-containing protein [Spirochaetota bacterium]HQH97377.1 carboxypeptidase regulatory-like domain-containing protein [Spirochaetota bacterium]HQJ70888.1 carboxypeptidase regulatory-like domain-containing protein [Spirochaetota bacterium]